jgi:hypothetical protein
VIYKDFSNTKMFLKNEDHNHDFLEVNDELQENKE